MDFSIIIPALNEGHKIAADVLAATEFITANFADGEIIVVDDGSSDNTAEQAEVPVPPNVHLLVLRHDTNRGKGYAVRRGINASTGDYVMFADSGLCIPYDNALRGLMALRSGACDVAHGSRKRKDSVVVRPHLKSRRLTSTLFMLFLKIWLRLPRQLTDAQCGFKMYRGEVGRALYGEAKTDGFIFDLEIILRAKKKKYRICEFPVEWTADKDTRLVLAKMPTYVIAALWRLKKQLKKEKFEKRPESVKSVEM